MSSSTITARILEYTTWPGQTLANVGQRIIYSGQGWARFPTAVVGAPILSTGQLLQSAGQAIAIIVAPPARLCAWAWGVDDRPPARMDQNRISEEREREAFEKDRTHVAICGQAGSGKSSIINALRGIRNSQDGAAPTGTVETTTSRTTYRGHESLSAITLHDIPGGGTRRTSSQDYFDAQKLYLFDLLLIVHSGRLGLLDIEIVKSCIRIKQPFLIIRSQSDVAINSIMNDTDLDQEAAKMRHINTSLAALRNEFGEAGVPQACIEDMVKCCILINNQALRRCLLSQQGSTINEIDLVHFLRHPGQLWLKQVDDGKYIEEHYIGHVEVPDQHRVIVVTHGRVLLIKSSDLRTQWDLPMNSIKSVSVLADDIKLELPEDRVLYFRLGHDKKLALGQMLHLAVMRHNERFPT